VGRSGGRRLVTTRLAMAAVLASWMVLSACEVVEPDVVVWHAYRGAEAEAITEVAEAFREAHPEITLEVVPVPFQAYANKLTSSIPRDNGPDVFIFAQERIGGWADAGVIQALDPTEHEALLSEIPASLLDACRYRDALYGFPLSTKTTALFYNTELLASLGGTPPETTDELLALASSFNDPERGRFGLVYPIDDFYYHSAWWFGFGGDLVDASGAPGLDDAAGARSLAFAAGLQNTLELVPRDADYGVTKDLFTSGAALFAINGPWFVGELGDTPYGVVPLPTISETGRRASPFVTVESVFLSAQAVGDREADALAFATFLAGEPGARIRASTGRQVVTHDAALASSTLGEDPLYRAFGEAAAFGTPMPNRPDMLAFWEPARRSLQQVLRGSKAPEQAVADAQVDLLRALAPPPPPQRQTPYLVGFGLVLFVVVGLWTRRAQRTQLFARVRASRVAYYYVAPAAVGSVLLIFAPFVIGASLSLYAHEEGAFTFVGFANFIAILGAQDFGITHPQSFYMTLLVTVAWTLSNVLLHVSIGLGLALLLRDPWVKLRGIYRVLLIVPWAVPNYITALIWKSMFNFNFGSINGALRAMGLEPVDWFAQWATAFAANVTTNTWLGFPFMMVVSLGALQSIPRDLEDAAAVDGASRWQRFRHITLPLLRPALLPAVILGSVWTFNMFNIIYLVSGGGPDASTDILITEAYRWAFERQERYGYAAAYGVLIFGVLVMYTWLTSRVGASEQRDA
jgi:arabinogalactan oligomer/maltooligosaccharide transport system permease protein